MLCVVLGKLQPRLAYISNSQDVKLGTSTLCVPVDTRGQLQVQFPGAIFSFLSVCWSSLICLVWLTGVLGSSCLCCSSTEIISTCHHTRPDSSQVQQLNQVCLLPKQAHYRLYQPNPVLFLKVSSVFSSYMGVCKCEYRCPGDQRHQTPLPSP